MSNPVRRRYNMVWVWFLTASLLKTRVARAMIWFVPYAAMNAFAVKSGADLLFVFLSLLLAASFWFLGALAARRQNVRHEAEALASYIGEHPDLTEFDLKRGMRELARK